MLFFMNCTRRKPSLKGFQPYEVQPACGTLRRSEWPGCTIHEELMMPKNKCILLVDDDETIRTTLRTCLEAVGYQCLEAKDGQEAREWLQGGHSLDVIVTDYQMPRVNGLELIKGLKRQVNTESIPIIFYSGQLAPELKVQAIQDGVRAVLEKPFPLTEFLNLVAHVCEKTVK